MATKETEDQEGDAKFIKGFIACLKNGKVLGLLSDAVSGNVNTKLETIRNKTTDLKVEKIKRDIRIAKIENSQTTIKRKMDVYDQKARKRT